MTDLDYVIHVTWPSGRRETLRKEHDMNQNDPRMLAQLLRSIGSGSIAKEHKHDIIFNAAADILDQPIPMLLWCPICHQRHIDRGIYAQNSHHSHACQCCGHVWRPAILATVGVQFLPGFKDEEKVGEGNGEAS